MQHQNSEGSTLQTRPAQRFKKSCGTSVGPKSQQTINDTHNVGESRDWTRGNSARVLEASQHHVTTTRASRDSTVRVT